MPGGGVVSETLPRRRLGKDLRARAAAGLGGCPEGGPCRLQLDRPLTGYGTVASHTAWHPQAFFPSCGCLGGSPHERGNNIGCKMMTLQNDLSLPLAGLC